MGIDQLTTLIITNYQYQLMIDGNRSINMIDSYQCAMSIDYLSLTYLVKHYLYLTYLVKHFNCQFHQVLKVVL